MIEGLSHITFIVRDLDRMTDLLTTIFNAEEVYASGNKTFSISSEKFFLIGQIWIVIMHAIPYSTGLIIMLHSKSPNKILKIMQRGLSRLVLT